MVTRVLLAVFFLTLASADVDFLRPKCNRKCLEDCLKLTTNTNCHSRCGCPVTTTLDNADGILADSLDVAVDASQVPAASIESQIVAPMIEGEVSLFSSASMEVLEDHACLQRCSEFCSDETCIASCRTEFCAGPDTSGFLSVSVGVLCVIGLLGVAYSVFFGDKVKKRHMKFVKRVQERDYLSL